MLIKPIEKGNFTLVNDGSLELVFIGVGSAFAQSHFQTNFLIIKGDKHIMVDFGSTGQRALWKTTGLKPTDIELILPTHSHSDHIGGIECLALMNRYVGQRFMSKPKLKMIVTDEYQRILWDYSLKGGLEWNEMDMENHHKLDFADFFDVIKPIWKTWQPRETFELDLGDLHLEIFRTKHIPEQAKNWEASFVSYGLFIDDKVFVSCDTRFDQDLIFQYHERSEIMFHDVQFFPGAVHASLAELKTLPYFVKDKMKLMHYADNWAQQDISEFRGWALQGVSYIF